jgi:hypothetical protein
MGLAPSKTPYIDLAVSRAVAELAAELGISRNGQLIAIQIGAFHRSGKPNFQCLETMAVATCMSLREANYSQAELKELGLTFSVPGDRKVAPAEASRWWVLKQKGYAVRGLCGRLAQRVDEIISEGARRIERQIASLNAKAAEYQRIRIQKKADKRAKNEARIRDREQRQPDPSPPPPVARVQGPPDGWEDLFPKTAQKAVDYSSKRMTAAELDAALGPPPK